MYTHNKARKRLVFSALVPLATIITSVMPLATITTPALSANEQGTNIFVIFDEFSYQDPQINSIPSLEKDGDALESLAKRNSFEVVRVKNATKSEILGTLSKLRNRKIDQLIVFPDGHGSRNGIFLPSDCRDSPSGLINYLSGRELYDAVKNVGAKNSTICIDSCFSGSLMKSASMASLSTRGFVAKYYEPKYKVPGIKASSTFFEGPGIAYLCSSSPSQVSWATPEGSLIIQALVKQARIGTLATDTYGALTDRVARNVSESVKELGISDTQTPQCSPGFVSSPYFAWNRPANNPSLTLDVEVDGTPTRQTTLRRGAKLVVYATPSRDGYLVAVNRTTDGKFHRLFVGKVRASLRSRIPEVPENSLIANQVGTERIYLYLFPTMKQALLGTTKLIDGAIGKFEEEPTESDTPRLDRVTKLEFQVEDDK